MSFSILAAYKNAYMNYQEIPFFIWAKNKKLAETIGAVLGRELNTHLEFNSADAIYHYVEKTQAFTCYVLQYTEAMPSIDSLMKIINRKCLCSPVILFSFQEITDSTYRKMIRSGISDILIYEEDNNHKSIRRDLLKTINNRWKMFLCFEKEKKKVYQATIVTAYHEINQPLTVILNAVGLINMELNSLSQKLPKIEKYLTFIIKGIKKIQEILDRFKGIKNPEFDEYTEGVPMIVLSDLSEMKKEKQSSQKMNKENTVLILLKNLNLLDGIGLIIEKAGYHPVFLSDNREIVKLIKSKLNKIQAVLIDVDISSELIEEIIFEMNLNMPNRSVILLFKDKNIDETQKIMKKGTFLTLKRPFNPEQFKTTVEKTQKSILM